MTKPSSADANDGKIGREQFIIRFFRTSLKFN